MARRDYRKEVTDRIIELIENNQSLPWSKGWSNVALSPFNPFSKTCFRKGNKLNLLVEQSIRDSIDPRWMTLKQINKAGLRLRALAKGALVEYWFEVQRKDDDDLNIPHSDESGQEPDNERKRMSCRIFVEFNGADIIGLPELSYEKAGFEPNELIERLVLATGVKIQHRTVTALADRISHDEAFFSHGNDTVVLPPKGAFTSDANYYATLLHELVHWTGHHSRLNRRGEHEERSTDSPEYAREELRAEYGSALLCSMFGLAGELENHASYLHAYLQLLKEDKNELFRAASDVDGIIDYLFEFDPELREIIEGNLIEANTLSNNDPDKPVNQADLGGLPDFTNVTAVQDVAPVTASPWERCQKIIEQLYLEDGNLTPVYLREMTSDAERGRFEQYCQSLEADTEDMDDEFLTTYGKRTLHIFRNAKCFHDVWLHYNHDISQMLSDTGVLADRLNNEQRRAFLADMDNEKQALAKITAGSRSWTYEYAKSRALDECERLWGVRGFLPINAEVILKKAQDRYSHLADDFDVTTAIPLFDETPTPVEPSIDTGSAAVVAESIPHGRYDIDDEDEPVLSTLGNAMSFDENMQP